MKVIRLSPGLLSRLKHGFPTGFKVLVSTTGLSASAIGILAAVDIIVPFWTIGCFGSFIFFTSLCSILIKTHISHLPDKVIFEQNIDNHYIASFCSSETLRAANALTKPFYRHESVSDSTAEIWRQKNPEGFVHLLNHERALCACFGILALEDSFMRQFIKGRVLDNDLLGDDILDVVGTKKSSTIYISGVVVRDPHIPAGNRRACVMIWAMLRYIEKTFGFRRRRKIYALAVSKESENILRNCGFSIASSSELRKDRLNLYSLDLTKQNIKKIDLRFGDYSHQCTCDFL